MNRLVLLAAAAFLVAGLAPVWSDAAEPFDQKLTADRQIVHVLNRLTFGPRPGDVEEVRRIGLDKWIEQQLHPEGMPENPALEQKLMPLESLHLSLTETLAKYGTQPVSPTAMMAPMMSINQLLAGEDMRKVVSGTAEERAAVLKALDPEKRRQVLAAIPPNLLASLPDYQNEAVEARRMRNEELQREIRRRNPPLQDLLSPDQLMIARQGNREQLLALFEFLEPDKRGLVAAQLPQPALAQVPEIRRLSQMQRIPRQVPAQDLKEAKLFRAIHSNRQLEEVLVDFWFNHFNVDLAKNIRQTTNIVQTVLGSYERDAIRPHVLGHFKDMLAATARHPAMLMYLDNWESMAPDSIDVGPFAPQRGVMNGRPNSIIPSPLARIAHGLNENYGREVMELHTLGVDGGYTQADVIAVARAFTGWTLRDPHSPEFVFAPFMHDFSEKTVLGQTIPAGGGEQDGLKVLDILARHPSTAKFISRKLAQRFVADNPPAALVDRMAERFTKTDGDLRAVLETMFRSMEFRSEGAWLAKVKSPLEMVVSAVRATGAETSDTFTLAQKVADLGQPLYNRQEPTGYPNTGDIWLSSVGVMGRANFASALCSGLMPGVKADASRWIGKDPATLARDVLGRDASPQTLAAIEQATAEKPRSAPQIVSLLLSSPDFQRR